MKTAPHPPHPPLPHGLRHHHHQHIQSSGIMIQCLKFRKMALMITILPEWWWLWWWWHQKGNWLWRWCEIIPMLICFNLDWDKSMWLWNQFLNLKLACWCLLSPSPQTLFVPRHLVSNIRERNKLMFLCLIHIQFVTNLNLSQNMCVLRLYKPSHITKTGAHRTRCLDVKEPKWVKKDKQSQYAYGQAREVDQGNFINLKSVSQFTK